MLLLSPFFKYTMAIIVGELFSFIPCNRCPRKRPSISRRHPTPPHPIGFPAKWCQRNKSTNSILMTCHCTQIFVVLLNGWGKFLSGHRNQSIRSTFQNRVVTRHQCGVSAVVSQTSFGGKISGDVSSKRRLFSQVTAIAEIFFSAS